MFIKRREQGVRYLPDRFCNVCFWRLHSLQLWMKLTWVAPDAWSKATTVDPLVDSDDEGDEFIRYEYSKPSV